MPALKQKQVKTALGKKLSGVKPKKPDELLWKGPEDGGPFGGITQSLLGAFLSCRERFRVKYVLGLQPAEKFSRTMEFGQMWHVCEENFAAHKSHVGPLTEYAQGLCQKYPLDQNEISKWYDVITTTFPLYVDWWAKHPDVVQRTPLLQEEVFHVPYRLPSGRVVYLRGKFDSVDLVGTKKDAGIWLKENKTKSEIDVSRLERQLHFDIQVMFYVVALLEMAKNGKN